MCSSQLLTSFPSSPHLTSRRLRYSFSKVLFSRSKLRQAKCMPSSQPRFSLDFVMKASISNNKQERSSRAQGEKQTVGTSGSSFQWRRRSETPLGDATPSKPKQEEEGANRENLAVASQKRGVHKGCSQGARGKFLDNGAANRTFSRIKEEDKKSVEKLEMRKKPPKMREQVRILMPLRDEPHVAILGGGMSGIICALTLQEKGIRSTVFDSGKHGLGGRMGTRHVEEVGGSPLVFDHAAQFFTVTDPRFEKLVKEWIAEGIVRHWDGVVGTLGKGGQFTELSSDNKYVAVNGMRLLADYLLSKRRLIDVKRPCWISSLKEVNGMWYLMENEKDQGNFDMVVIAHNGKCANRLLGPVGAPLVAQQMKRLQLSSIWALMAAFQEPFPSVESGNGKVQFDGAFVSGIDSLSWMGNNTSKLQLSHGEGPHCWTFFSTGAYGEKHKVPQESIPTVKVERVKREMLEGVEKALGLASGTLPTPLYMKVQLWGAALPLNTPEAPCLFDAFARVGVCGDWLLGSNVEAAALSGMAIANHISDYCDARGLNPGGFCVGLMKEFSHIDGHDIGQFSVAKAIHEPSIAEVLMPV